MTWCKVITHSLRVLEAWPLTSLLSHSLSPAAPLGVGEGAEKRRNRERVRKKSRIHKEKQMTDHGQNLYFSSAMSGGHSFLMHTNKMTQVIQF